MRAGDLHHQVTIQSRAAASPQKTARGAPDEPWTPFCTAWAAIEPLRGREFLEAQSVQSEVTTRIRIRYRASVTAGMRVVHGATVYDIAAVVNPKARNVELHLMCTQGASNG
jgi:SPP1 family predicted phage head-tail adaptor